jgi:hypothetical protein
MMLKFKKMVKVDVFIVNKKLREMDQSAHSDFQSKSEVCDFKGWWAYSVDSNDPNYNTK